MKIPMQKATDALLTYLGSQATQIPSMGDKFLMYAALGAARSSSAQLLGPYMNTLRMVGVVDEQGMVCTDAIRAAMTNAFANVPTFSALGFNFTQSDAEDVLRLMEG